MNFETKDGQCGEPSLVGKSLQGQKNERTKEEFAFG